MWARLALLWLDAKEVPEDASGSAMNIATVAVQRWANRLCEGLDVFKDVFQVHLAPKVTDLEYEAMNCLEDNDEAPDYWGIGIYLGSGPFPYLLLEPKLKAIEDLVPGLGETTLHYLQITSYQTLTFMSPMLAHEHIAPNIWWQGSDSQDEFLAEMQAQGYDEKEIEDMPSPKKLQGETPSWVIEPKAQLKPEQIERIARRRKLPAHIRELAKLLLDLIRMESQDKYYRLPPPICYAEQMAFGAYLRWNGDDLITDLMHDFEVHAQQCGEGFTMYSGFNRVPLTDADAFMQWKAQMEGGFELLRKQDRVLQIIGERVI